MRDIPVCHTQGAKNLYTQEDIMNEFFSSPPAHTKTDATGKRDILIFHCEFSSERGPNLYVTSFFAVLSNDLELYVKSVG